MSTKKAGGSTLNRQAPNPKHNGVKKFGGEQVLSGMIIMRQFGNKFFPGKNVGQGKDFTLFAKKSGVVKFIKGFKNRTYISIE